MTANFARSFSALMVLPVLGLAVPATADEPVDLTMISRIRDEGLQRSQVMKTLRALTDDIGPRLTGSPQMTRANHWTRDKLAEWGLSNAHLEGFQFGRGWSYSRASVHMIRPRPVPLSALPEAWTPGTDGPVRGLAVRVELSAESDFERYRGKLAGKIVLLDPPFDSKPPTGPIFRRYSGPDLDQLGKVEISNDRRKWIRTYLARAQLREKFDNFLAKEKPLAMVTSSSRDAGLIRAMLPYDVFKVGNTPPAPVLIMAAEHYNKLLRLIEAKKDVELELDIRTRFHDRDRKAYNTVAEIPGTARRAELVMVGAHLDSWHVGTGAVDNAAGCAVAMEAIRILRTLAVRPRRTIRIALWSGEEQGLLGSRAYVARHFASQGPPTDPEVKKLHPWLRPRRSRPIVRRPGYPRLSAYFNLDNGSGRIRGIYAEGNAAIKPIFEAWLAPFHDLDATLVTMRGTSGTDHVPFDDVGLPGFQFVQDRLDYMPRLHHTHIDEYDHVQENDLKQASVIMASFLYHAAMRPQRLPRKPMPAMLQAKKKPKARPAAKKPARRRGR
ncbi:MAG: M20/M25/M40 family metallo-hydrolase [Proteobacteria bacterium]|nr:M20/M25/M40 family metallo-hydrolase [Pseudomonadota bacterium]